MTSHRTLGTVLVLVGIVLLAISLFVGWWMSQGTPTPPPTVTYTEYFGLPVTGHAITSCADPGGCGPVRPFSSLGGNATGILYLGVQIVVLAGIALGTLGAYLALAARGRHRWLRWSLVAVATAAILSVAAPAALALLQPLTLKQDNPSPAVFGPGFSFWGSETLSGTSLTWGPSFGWYLALGAFALLVAGLTVLYRARRRPPETSVPTTGPVAKVNP